MRAPVFDPSWGDEVKALYRHDMQEIWDRTIAPQVWIQYHNQLATYLGLVESGARLDILDVGCAQGTLALKLAERGHAVWAIDIRRHFLDYAQSRHEKGEVHFVQANALEFEIDRRFDVVFCNQMIEHVVYPVELLTRLKALLKAGGKLVVTTPNFRYFVSRLPSFSEIGDPAQHAGRQHSADADGHFYAYSPEELRQIFIQSGFDKVDVEVFESPWVSGHCKARHLIPHLPTAVLKALDRLTLRLPLIGTKMGHQLIAVGSFGAGRV